MLNYALSGTGGDLRAEAVTDGRRLGLDAILRP